MYSEGFRKGYKMIFSFPSLKITIAELLVALAFLAIVSYAKHLNIEGFRYLTALFVLFFIMRLADPALFTLRRSLSLMPPALLLWTLIAIISRPENSVLISLFALMYYAAIRAMKSGRRAILTFLSVVIADSLPFIGAAFWLIGALIFEATLYIVEKRGAKIGIDAIESFRGFAEYILTREKRGIEETLVKLSSKKRLYLDAYTFYDCEKKPVGSIVILYIHPGPFRDLGSSALPSILLDQARKRGYNLIVFHGPSTHGEDLAQSAVVKKVVNTILSWLNNPNNIKGMSAQPPRTIKGKYCCVHTILLGNPIIMLEHVEKGEDFPFETVKAIWQRYPNASVIDLHNSLGDELGNPKCAETLQNVPPNSEIKTETKCRLAVISKPSSLSPEEVGPGGVAALYAEINGASFYALIFDGNNAVPGLREYLQNELRKRGFPKGVVGTTDTHLMSGMKPGVDYTPLGGKTAWTRILEESLNVLNQAKRAARSILFYSYRRFEIDALALDEDKLKELSKITEKNVRDVTAALALAFSLPLLYLILKLLLNP